MSKTHALHWRRTKIIATLGPASREPKQIESLIKAGVNVFRFNMSHGDHEQHRENFVRVREAGERLNAHVAILMDLCGPKIRVGLFKEGQIELKARQRVTVTTRNVIGEPGLIPSQYHQLHKDAKVGERVLLDDGNLELVIEAIDGTELTCKVVYGGILKDKKGMNLPDSDLSVPAFTKKDKEDAALAAELGADFLALSFVRNAGDVQNLQRFMKRQGREIPIVSKIEKPEAVENIHEILEVSYAIMVARGDLGIELPAERVPLIQKDLIQLARSYLRPVIVATQMMESMITNSRPTRAEVGDVANAAAAGTDAVMLSGETAGGKYPLKTVQAMDKVLREMEGYQWSRGRFGDELDDVRSFEALPLRKGVAHAVTALADDLKLQGIIIPTRSGTTAQIIAADRPTAPCMGVSSSEAVCRRLALHWGVVPVHAEEDESHDWHELSVHIARDYKLTHSGNTVLLVSGFHEPPQKSEPVMKLIQL